jgi:hypothetical protein
MKKGKWLVFGLLGLVLVFGLSGCIITSASPDPNTIVEMKPGDKVLFKVEGPVNTSTTRCVWTITEKNFDWQDHVEGVSEGKNEFELVFNSDSRLSNGKNVITCEYQSYGLGFANRMGICSLGWGWFTTDSRKWEVKTNPNSDTIITGDYVIGDDSDLQFLKGYTTVTGSLIIGRSIKSLSGLESLTSVGRDFGIEGNGALTSLSGLENITSVGGNLYIAHNALTSLSGLDNLTSVGGSLGIEWNPALTSLTGLENITSVGGYLSIRSNAVLTSLSSLENLTSVGGYLLIWINDALTSLSGLENLASVGGYLWIWDNPALTSLSGLENLTSIGGDLVIQDNNALTNLSGLQNITSVGGDLRIGDEHLGNPALTALGMTGLQRVDGDFLISYNPLLCTSLAEELMNQVLAGEGIGGTRYIGGNKACTTP